MILNIKTNNDTYSMNLNNSAASLYMYESVYANYIDNIISNEEALARSLKSAIPVTESSYSNIIAITEGSLSDNIKARCSKLVEFIKNLFAKFMESLTKILLNQKDYLKKYEDIIKKKRPKAGLEVTYTGNYEEAIKRCINTQVPVFDYGKYGDALKKAIADGDGDNKDEDLVKAIMQGHSFTYDNGESLDTMLKNYFINAEAGEKTHAFSEMNFTNMYNFCYNFDDFEKNNKKDLTYLEQSTSAIEKYVTSQLNSQGETKASNNTSNTDNKPQASKQDAESKDNNDNKFYGEDKDNNNKFYGERYNIINNLSSYNYFVEANESDNKETPAGKTGATINTNAPSQMSSYDNRDSVSDDTKQSNANAAKDVQASDFTKMTDKWNNICRIIIGAKLNAVTQIAKDYMTIIREHVRSYIGKKDDSKDSRTAQQGDDYSQYRNKKTDNSDKKEKPTNNSASGGNGG